MHDPRSLALAAARIAHEHKAESIRVLDLGEGFVSDCFVIATILNRPHARAVAEALLQHAKTEGIKPLGMEGLEEGTWVLIDFGTVVVHLFETQYRSFYDLEGLWGDAKKVPFRPPAKRRASRARA